MNSVSFTIGTGTSDVVLLARDIVAGSVPPEDIDDDGLYEDVNGRGGLGIGDIQALYDNLDNDAVQRNVEAFDFNNNGRIDIGDVQRLYSEYLFS